MLELTFFLKALFFHMILWIILRVFKVRAKQYAWVDLNIFCQANYLISAVSYTFPVLHWPMMNSEKHFHVFRSESIFCSFHKTSLHHRGTCQAQFNDRRAVEHHKISSGIEGTSTIMFQFRLKSIFFEQDFWFFPLTVLWFTSYSSHGRHELDSFNVN